MEVFLNIGLFSFMCFTENCLFSVPHTATDAGIDAVSVSEFLYSQKHIKVLFYSMHPCLLLNVDDRQIINK